VPGKAVKKESPEGTAENHSRRRCARDESALSRRNPGTRQLACCMVNIPSISSPVFDWDSKIATPLSSVILSAVGAHATA
jgi:hypothetical protein